MDQTVCGYTNWDTFAVGVTTDNDEPLWTELWDILKEHGDNPDEARPLLRDFYQDVAYPIANMQNDGVDFQAVNWDELIEEALAEWATERRYYKSEEVEE